MPIDSRILNDMVANQLSSYGAPMDMGVFQRQLRYLDHRKPSRSMSRGMATSLASGSEVPDIMVRTCRRISSHFVNLEVFK